MKLYIPKLIEIEDQVKIQADFEYSEGIKTLWYSVNKKYAKYLTTEKSDAFVVGLLLLAMQKNEDIHIEGKMSEKLYYNLNNYYINMLSLAMPQLHQIKLYPESLDDGTSYDCEQCVGTGFSGGVDSFSTIYDHMSEDTPKSYKITHFLFNNVGSHDEFNTQRADKLFKKRYDLLKSYPEETGKDFIKINSNLSELLNMTFVHTHTTRNASCALLLQKLFSKYYYSSGFKIDATKIPYINDMHEGSISYCDPIAQKYLCTETFSFITTGLQYDKVEKTRLISDYEPTYRYLNICINDESNCSTCYKCCRTIFTLQLLNKFEKYSNIFDSRKFKKIRNLYFANILIERSNIHNKEVLKLAKNAGFRFPITSYLLIMPVWILNKIKKPVKSLINLILGDDKFETFKYKLKNKVS